MAKPTKYPDWAVNTDGTDHDVIDPTSLQNNVVEPTAGKKLTGWTYTEKPPRNIFNWLARITTQWIRWIDDYIVNTIDVAIGTIQGQITTLQGDIGIGSGSITADPATSQYMTVSLPTGFTDDNCYVLGGWLNTGAGEELCLPGEYRQSDKRIYTFHDMPGNTIQIHIQWADGFGSRTITASVVLKKK
jgi:hypothetical protein